MMNVPKFTSFRPKPNPPSSSKDEDRSRSKRPAREPKRPDKRRRSRSKERKDHVSDTSLSKPRSDPDSDIFVVDGRGDMKNLVYGGIHRYDISRFRRIGAGSVLGLKPDIKIQRDISDEKGLVLASFRNFNLRRREKYVFSRMEKPRLLTIRPQATSEQDCSMQFDFLPLILPRGKKRKRLGSGGPSCSSSDDESKHYRSIQGKAKSDQPSDSAFQYAVDSDSSEPGDVLSEDTAARKINVELSRQVEDFPSNLEAWLALISHQDILLRGGSDRRRVTNAEIQSTAEIKIHMFEKALERSTSLNDKEMLLKGLMAEGAKIWEVKHQLEKWEQVARQNIESVSLWKSYLDFKQTTFTTFRFEEVRELYLQRFKLLCTEITNAVVPGTNSLSKQLVYVLLRYTLFLHNSGFRELAVAIWQASLELNFRAPSSYTNWKTEFQEFWESEASRIGEDGSLGWNAFHKSPENAEPTVTRIDEPIEPVKRKTIFSSWALAERKLQQASNFPAKTMDETVEDDPFRVILFPDIEDFLFMFPSSQEDIQQSLIDGYCLFCRLPPIGFDKMDWLSDAFVRDDILGADIDWISAQYSVDGIIETEKPILSVLKTPCQYFTASAETYFDPHWFCTFATWKEAYGNKEGKGPVSYHWVQNTFRQLLSSYFSDDLAEYFLAFEWRNEPENIKKTAKWLLKTHSNNLRLYNAFGMIEWARSNKEAASAIFTAALNMISSMPEDKRLNSIFLWKSWIWCCLEDGDHDSALKYLLSVVDGAPNTSIEPTPTNLIRTKQYLVSNRDYLLMTNSTTKATTYTELLALLAYLTSNSINEPQSTVQGNISSFLSTIFSFSESLTSRNQIHSHQHELLLQSSARLLFNHARIGPFRPALLRSTLQYYLSLFPSNTMFLSLYTWNESRFRVENRVRSLLTSNPTPSLTQLFFRIRYELQHGTIHSAKAAFEAAVSPTSSAKSNPGIWKLYVFFISQHFMNKTKEVWYRSLRACPWAKELYVLGFELLSGTLEFGELKGTWRVLGEKGLRVHVDLEEVFEDLE